MINTNQSEHQTSWPPPIQADGPAQDKPRRGVSVAVAATLAGILGPSCWAIWMGIFAVWPYATSRYLFIFMNALLYAGPALSFAGCCMVAWGGRTRLGRFRLFLCLVGFVAMGGFIFYGYHLSGHWPQLMSEKEVECGCS